MSDGTLLVAWGSQLVVALLYGIVGVKLSQRTVSGAGRLAHRAFLVFWFGLMGSSLLGALQLGLYIVGGLPLSVYSVVSQANLLLIVAALWGILAYLVYLYTGSTRAMAPLTVFYALFFIALEILVLSAPATETITANGWTLQALPEPDWPAWVGIGFLLFLIGPQVGAAIAFLSLYPRVDDITQKYRIAMVGGSILVWFGVSLVVSLTGDAGEALRQSVAWQLFSRLMSIGAASAILMAYLPPKWVQAKGIRSIADES